MKPECWNRFTSSFSELAFFNPVPSLDLGDLDTFGNGIVDLWVTWDEYNYLKDRVSIVLK